MLFIYEQAYANVESGLLEAPEHISAVFQDRAMRYVVEALLLDNSTPEGVYLDLLGWKHSDVKTYKKYFFCIPDDMPRLYLYKFIESCPRVTQGDSVRYDLFLGVYDYGWPYIDTTYNRGNRITVQSRAMYSLKKMFGQIDSLVVESMNNPTTGNIQGLIKLLKTAMDLEAHNKAGQPAEQLRLSFVREIQEEGAKHVTDTSKIMAMEFNELNQVRPVPKNSAMQATLEEIYKDLPKAGQEPTAVPEPDPDTDAQDPAAESTAVNKGDEK